VSRASHLVRRFFRSLRPQAPAPADEEWAAAALTALELGLWNELPAAERAYSVRVARFVEHELAATPFAADSTWVAAALLHDVGKLDAGYGVTGRVIATVIGVGVSRDRARRWAARTSGPRHRIGCYLVHDERGAARIRSARGRDAVATWAEVHHRREQWAGTPIPAAVSAALAAADDR
jgi:hypothetical protein